MSDLIVMVLVTAITVLLHNLALAVLIGVIIAALVFAWENAKRIRARKYVDEVGVRHYEIYGPLFFGSAQPSARSSTCWTTPVKSSLISRKAAWLTCRPLRP
ncbi:hypothetical protein LRS06_23505 [Hymenobacter sp. J193]|nr:hypothetical protein [Hymenobacter sp. J193]